MNDLELIDQLISRLRILKSTIKRKNKLSEKSINLTPANATQKRIQKVHADLNWECMYVDQRKTDVARLFKNSVLDVHTGEKTYCPSPFHKYKY